MNEKKKEMRMPKKEIRKSRQKISFQLYEERYFTILKMYLQDFSNSGVKREFSESGHNVRKCFSSFLQETHFSIFMRRKLEPEALLWRKFCIRHLLLYAADIILVSE